MPLLDDLVGWFEMKCNQYHIHYHRYHILHHHRHHILHHRHHILHHHCHKLNVMCFCYNTVLNTYSLRHTGWFSFAIMIKLEFRIKGIKSNKNARKKCHFYISQSGLSSSTHISRLHFSIGDIGVVFHFCREVFWSNKASIRDFCSPQIQIGDFHR